MRTELITTLSRSSSSASINRRERNYKDNKGRSFSIISGILPPEFSNFSDDKSENGDNATGDAGCLRRTFTRKNIERKLPFLKWGPAYTVEKLLLDVIAGITVGLTILPQGLAYASVAELPGQVGLYSCFVGSIVYIIFGSTMHIKIGPTAVLAIMTASYKEYVNEYAILITFISGVVTSLMGLFQLGFLTNFISTPVISGFTNAAAVIICMTQIKALFGLTFESDEGMISLLQGLWKHLYDISLWDSLLSIFCFTFLFILKMLPSIFSNCITEGSIPFKTIQLVSSARSAIVVMICTLIFIFIGKDSPVQLVGEVERGLPPFQVPPFHFTHGDKDHSIWILIKENLSMLVLLPLLGLMEHVTSAKAFLKNKRLDVNQEMLANGLTNVIGSFFGALVSTGSLSLTTVNHASGCQTPLGGVVTVALVIISLEYLTQYFFFIPKATLACVIIFSVMLMIDLKIFILMWRSKNGYRPLDLNFRYIYRFFKMILTLTISTRLLLQRISLFLGLEYGLLFGFSISVVFLLYYAASARVKVKRGLTAMDGEFIMISLDRSLVFPSVEYIRHVVAKSGSVWAKEKSPVVIDGHHIQVVDYSASLGIMDLYKSYNERGQPLILWRLKPSILRVIRGVMESEGIPFKHCSNVEELESTLQELQNQDQYIKGNSETSTSFSFTLS